MKPCKLHVHVANEAVSAITHPGFPFKALAVVFNPDSTTSLFLSLQPRRGKCVPKNRKKGIARGYYRNL